MRKLILAIVCLAALGLVPGAGFAQSANSAGVAPMQSAASAPW